MKKILLLLYVTVFTFKSYAQDCKGYFFLVDNSQVEMTSYDKKNKASGKNVYKVSKVTKDGNGYSSLLSFTSLDDKGKTISSGEGKFKCDGASIDVDMKMSMPSEQMSAYKDMEVKSNDAFINYPTNIQTGQTLPDGKFSMEVLSSGTPFSDISYEILNRKVQGKETVTTPAGSWECFKIAYDAAMNIRTMGIGMPVSLKVIEWYAPGFGVVKTETYSKNDKLVGSTLLTGITK